MEFSSVREALGDDYLDEPAVVVRLSLMAADEASGLPKRVSSLMRRISMPPMLASPHVEIALEIQGERRVFRPTHVTWDETCRVCIVEVEWLVAESGAEAVEHAEPWPV
jgi:hypothetical protein